MNIDNTYVSFHKNLGIFIQKVSFVWLQFYDRMIKNSNDCQS